ncbi:MAG: hypothetical protein A4E64_02834 [Syntrophorhabdus sp. PtaU1.Bin058]|nr:MAG: hypothetical protein A4E64_02834 [Syntrophorhabdus sp. PtaU1.Bin058]
MNDTPLPFTVSAMSTLGESVTFRNCLNTRASLRKSWPLHRFTYHPDAFSLASRFFNSMISFTGLSVWTLLKSIMAQMLFSPWCVALWSDSQTWPSWNSPSPVSTKTLPPLFLSLFAKAMPFAFDMPMPREPVFASMPGVVITGWPSRPLSLLRVRRSSSFKTPAAVMTE